MVEIIITSSPEKMVDLSLTTVPSLHATHTLIYYLDNNFNLNDTTLDFEAVLLKISTSIDHALLDYEGYSTTTPGYYDLARSLDERIAPIFAALYKVAMLNAKMKKAAKVHLCPESM